ncbi:hypothetical protein BDZ91DRAFT_718509, partial [Kalaharituber pfeilii]
MLAAFFFLCLSDVLIRLIQFLSFVNGSLSYAFLPRWDSLCMTNFTLHFADLPILVFRCFLCEKGQVSISFDFSFSSSLVYFLILPSLRFCFFYYDCSQHMYSQTWGRYLNPMLVAEYGNWMEVRCLYLVDVSVAS